MPSCVWAALGATQPRFSKCRKRKRPSGQSLRRPKAPRASCCLFKWDALSCAAVLHLRPVRRHERRAGREEAARVAYTPLPATTEVAPSLCVVEKRHKLGLRISVGRKGRVALLPFAKRPRVSPTGRGLRGGFRPEKEKGNDPLDCGVGMRAHPCARFAVRE
jgi:hypothetical protein